MVVAVLVAVWIQLTRSSHAPVWDTFWAEDGRYFYSGARNQGFWHTLFEPLGGYLQIAPRLLSGITAAVPVADAAMVNALLAATTVALLALYVFTATEGVLSYWWQRFGVAALLVALPPAAFEVNAAVNNLHWFLMIAAFWACWSQAETSGMIALDTAVVALAALSDPLTGLLLPLVAWRAWRKGRSARWMTAGLLAALAMQYWLGTAGHAPGQNGSRDLDALPGVYGLRVAGSFLVGDQGLSRLWPAHQAWVVPTLALIVVAAGAYAAVSFARRRDRRLLIATVGYSVVFAVTPLATRGGSAGYLRHPLTLNGSRYTIVPLALLYSALLIAAGLPWRLPRPLAGRLVPGAAAVFILVQLYFNYAPVGPRTSGFGWRAQVQAARAACLSHKSGLVPGPQRGYAVPKIKNGIVQLPQAPFTRAYSWSVVLPCKALE